MPCIVCGSRGSRCQQKRKTRTSFCFDLGQYYLDPVTVPCFVKRQFNNLVGNVFDVVAPDGTEYRLHLKKRVNKTRIFGSGYEEFISDYAMNAGDRIRILLDNAPQSFGIVAEGPTGIQKQRVQAGHHFEDDATVVVYTNDIHLTEAQSGRMNDRIGERGLGMEAVLVHKLTTTDIKHNGMRISKDIVKAWNIAKSGWVILGMGKHDNFQDAEYRTTTDGRMRFKLEWKKFVQDFDLKAGLVVLSLFHMEGGGYVKVSFDAL